MFRLRFYPARRTRHTERNEVSDIFESPIGEPRCTDCGATIYSGPPDCPLCGAPNCCPQCCKVSNLTESNRQLREELERSNARGTEFYEGLINVSNKNLACQTALAADRKLLCRIATFLTQCDSSSPKVPELIADIEKSLSGVNEHHELTTRTALAAAKEALERIVGDRIDEDHPDLTNGQVMGEYSVGDMRQAKDALAFIAASEKENSNVAPADTSA